MRLAVDGGGYHSAARALRGGNEMAALHYGTLAQKLAAFAGVAGDDVTSEEFAQQYDAAAQEAIDGLNDVVDAFATLCGLGRPVPRPASARGRRSHLWAPELQTPGGSTSHLARSTWGTVRLTSSLGANDSGPAGVLGSRSWTTSRATRGPTPTLLGFATRRPPGGLRQQTSTGSTDVSAAPRSPSSKARTPPRSRSPRQALRDLRRAVGDLSSSLRSVGDACDEVRRHRRGAPRDRRRDPRRPGRRGRPHPRRRHRRRLLHLRRWRGRGRCDCGLAARLGREEGPSTLRALEALAKARAVARLTSVVEKVRPLRKVLERLKSAKRLRKGGKPAEPGGKVSHHKPPRRPGDPLDPGDAAA